MCSKNGIILYCLKAPASGLKDQTVFSPMKAAWQEAVRKHVNKTMEAVTLRTFAQVLKVAWYSTSKPSTAVSGFLASGLFPYNPLLNSDKLKPSETFAKASDPLQKSDSVSARHSSLESLKEMLHLSLRLGEDTVRKYMNRFENGFDIPTDSV